LAPRREPITASRDVLRQVRRIDLRTRGLVNSRFSGEYHSVFKGQGIEFAEVRQYLPGDDVRSIDWNVTARLGEPYLKRYIEERELTVLLVVDLSGSQRWGSRGRMKSELVVEVVATLAMSAIRNNDRVGLLLSTSEVEWFVPPRKGRRHVLRLVRDLLAFRPIHRGTDLAAGLEYAVRLAPSRSIVFVFSDFRLGDGWDAFSSTLTAATARHDVVAVHLTDPLDEALPAVGLLAVRDPETGATIHLDTSSAAGRHAFTSAATNDEERARRLFRRRQVDEIRLRTDAPYNRELLSFFQRRERRLRR
jgi:uncharacterized protein (DUF58 family)